MVSNKEVSNAYYTPAGLFSPLDARQKIYIQDNEEISAELFNNINSLYPHLRVHVHKKLTEGKEECIGVYEIDEVEATSNAFGKIISVKVKTFHQVYSTAYGSEEEYLDKEDNTDTDLNYNEKFKNIIFYTDKGNVYLNGDSYGGGGGVETYTPNASDSTEIDIQSVTAADLKGKSFNEVLDTIFFPEYDAFAGTLPFYTINNPNLVLEVGENIGNATAILTEGSSYRYIKDGGILKEGNYTIPTPPTITTTITDNKTKAIFGELKRTASSTGYTVVGPSTEQLASDGSFFKSKGTPSKTIKPLETGVKTLSTVEANIRGVYAGGKNGTKSSEIWVNSGGQLASTKTGTYSNTLSYDILIDNKNTVDHLFNTVGTKSVELYVPTGISYTVKLTATQYNTGNNQFEANTDLTTKLNNLTTIIEDKELTDAGGNKYLVKSYYINTSTLTSMGKFNVKMNITKN